MAAERGGLGAFVRRGRVDVVEDLVNCTGLPLETVRHLVTVRDPLSFRAEWWATPPSVRSDHWFYLASRGYCSATPRGDAFDLEPSPARA